MRQSQPVRTYPPVYDSLMRQVIALRRWYVASVGDLTVDEDQRARDAIVGLTKLADALKARQGYGRQ